MRISTPPPQPSQDQPAARYMGLGGGHLLESDGLAQNTQLTGLPFQWLLVPSHSGPPNKKVAFNSAFRGEGKPVTRATSPIT